MTYANRGDKVVLYAGNLPDGELQRLDDALAGEGVELLAVVGGPANISPAYAGPPCVLLVIEPPETEDAIDGDVMRECPAFGPHREHRWLSLDGLTYLCSGASVFSPWKA